MVLAAVVVLLVLVRMEHCRPIQRATVALVFHRQSLVAPLLVLVAEAVVAVATPALLALAALVVVATEKQAMDKLAIMALQILEVGQVAALVPTLLVALAARVWLLSDTSPPT